MAPRTGQTKRCVAAVAPPPKGGAAAEEWRRHPRLQRHFRSFDASANQAAVLGRYRRLAAGASDREPLFRETTHVAAWVALLPLEAPLLPDCARLLSRLLRRRPCGARSPLWLRGTLHLVALRLKELREEVWGELAEHWLDLRRSMPGSVWKALRASCPAIDGTGEKETEGTPKETERQTAQGACEDAGANPGGEAKVEAVLRDAAESLESGDADQMLRAVIEAAALLSAPRAAAHQQDGDDPMTESALDRLRAALQSRLRKARAH